MIFIKMRFTFIVLHCRELYIILYIIRVLYVKLKKNVIEYTYVRARARTRAFIYYGNINIKYNYTYTK